MGTERLYAGFLAPEVVADINALAKKYPILDEEPAMWHALVGICRLRPEAFKTPVAANLEPSEARQALMYLSATNDEALRQVAKKLELFREMTDIFRDRLHKPPEMIEAYEAGYALLLRLAAHIVAHARRK